ARVRHPIRIGRLRPESVRFARIRRPDDQQTRVRNALDDAPHCSKELRQAFFCDESSHEADDPILRLKSECSAATLDGGGIYFVRIEPAKVDAVSEMNDFFRRGN